MRSHLAPFTLKPMNSSKMYWWRKFWYRGFYSWYRRWLCRLLFNRTLNTMFDILDLRHFSYHFLNRKSFLAVLEKVHLYIHFGLFSNFLRLPFEWRAPLPYFLMMIVETVQYSISFTIHVNAAASFIAFCRILTAFCEDFDQAVDRFNGKIQEIMATEERVSAQLRWINLKLELRQLIQFHYDIKRSVDSKFQFKMTENLLDFWFS